MWKSIIDVDGISEEVQKKFSTDSEKERGFVDLFVNCDPYDTWDEIADTLYQHQQVAAVEEVKSHLPPRGEPCFE